MSFYGNSPPHRKIELNSNGTSSSSPEVLKRLDRIEDNYSRLDVMLTRLEAQFDLDARRVAKPDDDVQRNNVVPKNPK